MPARRVFTLGADGRLTPTRRPGGGRWHARRVHIDGHTFDSAKEARRYGELVLLARSGLIRDLEVHPSWSFDVNNKHIGVYTADFRYLNASGVLVVEDVKSTGTRREPDYRLRVKLLDALYDLQVTEVLR